MIGVLGATGRVGRHIAAGLAERGVEARALVRRPDPSLRLPVVHADLRDPETLPRGPGGVSFDAIAAQLGVRYLSVPPRLAAGAVRRRGLTPAEIDHATRMASYFAAGSDRVASDHVARLTGRPPRSVAAFLDEQATAFAPATRLARTLSRSPREENP